MLIAKADSQTGADKIEVWRATQSDVPLADGQTKILALVTDNAPPGASCRTFSRCQIDELIAGVVNRYLRS